MTARDRLVLGIFLTVAVLGGFWFIALKPKREAVAAAEATVATAQTKLDGARAQLQQAGKAKEKYLDNYATVADLGKAVPVDDDVSTLVYQLEDVARRNNINFNTVDLKAQDTEAAAAPATTNGANASGGSNANAASTVTATLPPGAAVGSAGFPTMPFSFTFSGSFTRLERFLGDVNDLTIVRKDGSVRTRGRLLQVDGVVLGPQDPKGFPHVRATIAATAYLLPADEGLTAGASPANPAPSSSTSPGAAPANTPSNIIRSPR